MPLIATIPAIMATTAAVGAGTSLIGAKLGSSAAKNAAKVQSDATLQAAQLNSTAANRATDLQRDQFNTQQQNLQPWLEAGKNGLGKLSDFINQDNNDFTDQFSFDKFKGPAAFDPASVQFDPGFQKRLEAGNKILTSGFAAKGNLGNGRAAEALMHANQDYTANEYQNAYARDYGRYNDDYAKSYGQYSDDYSRALGEYRQKADIFNQNKTNKFNRLASVAGIGQNATSQLGEAGGTYANNLSNILTQTASRNGQLTQEGAAATAAGNVGSANSWTNALQNILNNVGGSLSLSMINKMRPQTQAQPIY